MKDRIKQVLCQRSGIISVAVVIMLAVASLNYYVLANSVTVFILDEGEVTSFDSSVKTVEDILTEHNIQLNASDAVEPALDTKLIADSKIVIGREKTVTLVADGTSQEITTNARFVKDFFEENEIAISAYDKVTPSLLSRMTDGMQIVIERAFPIMLTDGTTKQVVYSCPDTVANVLGKNGVTLGEYDYVDPALDVTVSPTTPITVVRVTMEVTEATAPAEFKIVRTPNNKMAVGNSKTVADGVYGEKIVRTFIRYENGVEVSRHTEEEITKAPVEQVIEYGTQSPTTSTFAAMKAVAAPVVTSDSVAGYNYSKVMDFTATAYYGGGITKSGRPAQVGVVAVDPRVIPLGSKLYITSADGSWTYGYAIAGDTGGAIKGNIVDLYFNTYDECILFGRKKCIVYVLS